MYLRGENSLNTFFSIPKTQTRDGVIVQQLVNTLLIVMNMLLVANKVHCMYQHVSVQVEGTYVTMSFKYEVLFLIFVFICIKNIFERDLT